MDAPEISPARHAQLRAIIADDDPFVRRLVKQALQATGIVVVAEARTGRDAVELTLFYNPDVVLMDVVMPGVDGIAATQQILARKPEQAVILLTGSADEELALLGLRAGAVGFLTKEASVDALPPALEAVAKGEAAVSRGLTRRLIEHLRSVPEARPGMRPVHSPLTNREWEVIELLEEERSTAEIADALVVAHATARSHVKSILRKLHVTSRKEAVEAARALREGRR